MLNTQNASRWQKKSIWAAFKRQLKKLQAIDRAKGHSVGEYYWTCYVAWDESRSAPEQLHILDNLLMINEGSGKASYNHLSPVLRMHSINQVFIMFFKKPLCKTQSSSQVATRALWKFIFSKQAHCSTGSLWRINYKHKDIIIWHWTTSWGKFWKRLPKC